MRIATCAATALLLFAVLVSSAAAQSSGSSTVSRDYTYHPNGVNNPLVTQHLYYQDAANVLADLDSFQSLSIQYQSCAYVQS